MGIWERQQLVTIWGGIQRAVFAFLTRSDNAGLPREMTASLAESVVAGIAIGIS